MERNMERDSEVARELEDAGRIVLRFWSRDVLENPERCVEEIEKEYRKC